MFTEVTGINRDIPRVDFINLQVGSRRYYGSIYNNKEAIPEDEEESSLYIVLPRMTGGGELESFFVATSNFIPEAEQELRGHIIRDEENRVDEHIMGGAGTMEEPAPRRTITNIKLGWGSK